MPMPELMERPGGVSAAVLDSYVRQFEERRSSRLAEPDQLRAQRTAAIEAFAGLGFPSTRQEDWRFTNVAPISAAPLPRAAAAATPATVALLADFSALSSAAELVFVNGVFAPSLSSTSRLPAGVRVDTMSSAVSGGPGDDLAMLGRCAPFDRHAFTALNTALFGDAAIVSVQAGCRVEDPIHLVFLAESSGPRSAVYPRVLVSAGDASELRIIETYVGRPDQEYFTNAVTEVVVGSGAIVDHVRVQRESLRAFHVGSLHVRCGRQGSFSSHAFALGGALVRNEISVVLDDEGGNCVLNGLYLADGDTLVDNHTTIDHAKPHCESHELYKGVLGGRARGVFHGKIIVRPDAQKTDAKQTNKALLLSDHAQVNAKPQLEIFANDVKCTHGAAVGQLDDEAIFYLQARGIDAGAARRMLIEAFAGDVLGRIRLAALKSDLEGRLQARLQAMLAPVEPAVVG
jgi:Fe-S cluster assembly protein SufD